MGDLEEFNDDFDTKSAIGGAIEVPAQFNEVVDIVVSDSRAKAIEYVAREEHKEDARLEREQSKMSLTSDGEI
jgi:hypothetical protein